MAGGGGGGEGEPEFQIAPMVDVLLVLLIFFMSITSAQVLRLDNSIELPVAPDAAKKENSKNEAIVNVKYVESKDAAEIQFESRIYDDPRSLIDVLKARGAADPTYRVVIRGDHRLAAVEISRVMNVAAEAGIANIAFSTLNKK